VENPKINEKVAKVIEELKRDLLSQFHPKSIVISGSFGRGEATVIEESGKLKFLSDCEVILIPYKWIFNRRKLDRFEQDFYKRTGLKVEIWGFTPTLYLSLPFLNRKIRPTIANFDLKYGSKVIYGKDYLKKIPDFKPEDIPLWEGIRLLFNRMAEALEYFSFENPTEDMLFWTDKIVLACQDSLLLTLGKYHHSYRKRNELLQELFPMYLNEVQKEVPNFLELAIKSTNRKLKGATNVDDPVRYWFDISKVCDKVFRYIMKQSGIEFTDYIELVNKSTKHQGGRKSHIYNLITLLKFLVTHKHLPSLKVFRKQQMIYSLILLCYFGLDNEKYLKKCSEILSTFGLNSPSTCYSLRQLLNQVIYLWERYILMRG